MPQKGGCTLPLEERIAVAAWAEPGNRTLLLGVRRRGGYILIHRARVLKRRMEVEAGPCHPGSGRVDFPSLFDSWRLVTLELLCFPW